MNYAIRNTVAAVIAILLAACQPHTSQTPANDTPYVVGSTTRFVHDETRGFDSVAGINDGLRILITEIWYPVEHDVINDKNQSFHRASYGDYVFGQRDVHHLMMTGTTFFHLTPETVRAGVTQSDIDAAIDELFTRERNSFVDAPIATATKPWPIIVMTHGDAGSRYNMESVCEYLASHGYVVVAPEHTGNSPYSQISQDPALAADSDNAGIYQRMRTVIPLFNPDGTYGPTDAYGQSYTPLSSGVSDPSALVKLDQSLLQRVNDLRATLNYIDEINRDGPFAGQLDADRVGLMGRSYGGATTLAALALEPRFISGMAVVPLVMPDLRAMLPPDVLNSAETESVILAKDGPFGLGVVVKPTLLLSGAEDGLIIGVEQSMANQMGTVMPSVEDRYPLLRLAMEATDAPVVMGLLLDSNHGSFGVSGPFWWPQLKPNSQKRHFAPDQEFTLVDVLTAHQIQKELALNFFDFTVRGDQSAKDKLLDDRFAKDGLVLTSKNVDP